MLINILNFQESNNILCMILEICRTLQYAMHVQGPVYKQVGKHWYSQLCGRTVPGILTLRGSCVYQVDNQADKYTQKQIWIQEREFEMYLHPVYKLDYRSVYKSRVCTVQLKRLPFEQGRCSMTVYCTISEVLTKKKSFCQSHNIAIPDCLDCLCIFMAVI